MTMNAVIVVGYIPTPEGEAALERAIEEAKLRQAELLVVNSSQGDAYVDSRLVQTEDWTSLQDRLSTAGVSHQVLQPAKGHEAAENILEICHRHQADLVVIGLRRRSAVGKLLLGSTAQRILLHAECPVLTVRAST
jgi:nucleotide-binding universal stress UspA family protein